MHKARLFAADSNLLTCDNKLSNPCCSILTSTSELETNLLETLVKNCLNRFLDSKLNIFLFNSSELFTDCIQDSFLFSEHKNAFEQVYGNGLYFFFVAELFKPYCYCNIDVLVK